MMRCSPRRSMIWLAIGISVCLLLYLLSTQILVFRQKSILRYQLEKELHSYLGKSLDPQNDQEKEEEQLGFQRNGFNQFRSDRIALDREVPDTRDPRCVGQSYPSSLPSASVVIIFHNEAFSALLRTVTSVINRSPPSLLHEIILVDDFSDHDDLHKNLEDYIATESKIKLKRHKSREGLIRARMTGANAATGDVLVFLDSHCEVNIDWLQPLLMRIHINRKNVVCPVIDVISWEKLEYSTVRGPPGVRGGFNWNLQFKWKRIPNYEQKRRDYDETREVKSPTMAGGLFAIEKNYFFELGAYDPGMDIWGGENLELSFRIWMCGGELELVPCSRVGHIFRKRQPYTFPGGVDRILVKNNMRLAEAWMDEYKEQYYAKRPDIKSRSFGDISDRLAIRERLKCKSFKWFLETVYPELPLPNENLHHGGHIKNPQTGLCLDTYGRREGGEIGLFGCHGQAGNQDFGFTDIGELQFEDDLCLDVYQHYPGAHIQILNCHGLGGNQKWEYDDKTHFLKHAPSGLCVDVDGQHLPVMKHCNGQPSQEWLFARHYTPKKRAI